MKQLKLYIFIAVAGLCLAGCNTQKTATKRVHRETKEQQFVQKAIVAQPIFQTAEATKARVGITYAGQKINVNGSISIVTDSVILLSVQPLLGIEMFRIELTPQQILIVDKINRRYVPMTYAELESTTGLPVTFYDLQAVFSNRIFVIGKEQTEITRLPITQRITTESVHQPVLLQDNGLTYLFDIDKQTYALVSTQVEVGQAMAKVEYTNHTLQDEVYFPTTFLFRVDDGKNNITECDLTLLKVRFNQEVKIRKVDLKRYSQTTFNKLLSK